MFDPVKISWKGTTHVIPPDQVLRSIATVEEVITLDELLSFHSRRSAPLAKLAMAFAALLRSINVECSDDEVYTSMFSVEQQSSSQGAIVVLLSLMIPKDIPTTGSAPQGNAPSAGRASSRRTTKR